MKRSINNGVTKRQELNECPIEKTLTDRKGGGKGLLGECLGELLNNVTEKDRGLRRAPRLLSSIVINTSVGRPAGRRTKKVLPKNTRGGGVEKRVKGFIS